MPKISIEQQHLLSHAISTESVEVVIERISSRIKQQGDKPDVTVNTQLELLEQLGQFEFGRFLLLNQGINGYWTHYMLTHPWFGRKTQRDLQGHKFTELEQFLLDQAPILLATQQRFEIFLQENQKSVKNEATLACIPSGMMGELLYLNFENIDAIKLMGVDYDVDSFQHAESLAEKLKLRPWCEFKQNDAWDMHNNHEFDLISSNGLNVYEPNDQRVTQLYQTFYSALKQGGKLVTSFLTPPPALTTSCEWDMTIINEADLLKQKIIFSDILEAKWQCFRSSETTKQQLQSVGFESIELIYDDAKLFPTVVAYKQ
ncbi:MAG: class I SAM-dependent methyltransferase [Gammaproteobacteria bacterium]|nr:class I SAM-dependent methyltransferase [Gammaproteobacteria bacterium]